MLKHVLTAVALSGSSLTVGAVSELDQSKPIFLEVSKSGDRLTIAVVGRSILPFSARYQLSVRSSISGNTSSQSGNMTLRGGDPVTSVRLSLDGSSMHHWQATLTVYPENAAAYLIRRSAGE